MAGETNSVPTGKAGMPDIELDDPFATMNGLLRGILGALTNRDDETVWNLTGGGTVVQSQHVRFRVRALVFDVSAAGTVSFTVGTFTRTFTPAVSGTTIVPMPIVIERGTDVSLTISAGAVTGYLIGSGE